MVGKPSNHDRIFMQTNELQIYTDYLLACSDRSEPRYAKITMTKILEFTRVTNSKVCQNLEA